MKEKLHDKFFTEKWAKQEIHIHIVRPQQIDNYKNNDLLDTLEQKKSQLFLFDKDYMLFKASHIFLRQTLSNYKPVTPKDWKFSYDSFGKPSIRNIDHVDLKFNLSHTHSMIACAIGYRNELGVDIERHRPLSDFMGMCRLVLSEQEQRQLLSLTPQNQESLFFRYWTLKESCVKALCKGLSIPLHSIQYQHANTQYTINDLWQCVMKSSIKASNNLYAFYYNLPQKPYSLALTAQIEQGSAVPVIRLFDWQKEVPTPQSFTFNVLPS